MVHHLRAWWKLKAYRPNRVTPRKLWRWARQFPREYRNDLLRLAANLRFVSEKETVNTLVELNRAVLGALREDDVSIGQVIYMTTDTAGSSSGVMLNLLRDEANLERTEARFLHSRDSRGIQEATREIGLGAIIYVDDFAGTGKQFERSRRQVAEYVVGSFSEFFLLPCICEEAVARIQAVGVESRAGFVHTSDERPLRSECEFLPEGRRRALNKLSEENWGNRKKSLGFGRLATNVVFYRNAPNTTPLVFRGNLGQHPYHGIVPRFDDLKVGEF